MKKVDYRHIICIIITLGVVALGVFRFFDSIGRIIEACRDFGLSIAYYFKKKVLLSSIPFFIDNATPATVFFKCGDVADLQVQMEGLAVTARNYKDEYGCYDKIYSEETLVEDYKKLYSL